MLSMAQTLDRSVLAVLCADVADYSRMMDTAEEETHKQLMWLLAAVVTPVVENHEGRIVKFTGDGFLACFGDAVSSVNCALRIQEFTRQSQMKRDPERRIQFRIGATIDSVIIEDNDIFGIAVNTASRLQQMATPGAILVSSDLFSQINGQLNIPSRDCGRIRLKNFHSPTHAFLINAPRTDPNRSIAKPYRKKTRLPAIAVFPFSAFDGSGGDDYFSQGLMDGIIGALSSLRDIMTINRGSTIDYNVREAPAILGKRLGANYVLTGVIGRSGDGIRVTCSLTDVRSGSVLWSDHMDGTLSSIFDMQDSIATKVVGTIAPHVREAELARAVMKRPENMDAYDLLLQGIDLLYRMDSEQFIRARKFLDSAIETDSRYPPAYAYASLWHIFNIGQGWSADPTSDSYQAWKLASAAVDRDASNSLALAICGHVKSYLFHEYAAATSYFERAINCSPSHAWAWALSSGTYAYMGDAKEAVERAERGIALSPADRHAFYYLSFLGLAHYAGESYEAAVDCDRKAVGQNPHFRAGLRVLIASLVALGRLDEAKDAARALLAEQPSFRVSVYAPQCPWWDDEVRTTFLRRLIDAGLPE